MAIFDLNIFNRAENAFTKKCTQYNWGAKYYFPCCPEELGKTPLEAYFLNLKLGSVLAYNDNSPKLIILKFKKIKNNSAILIMCEREGQMCEKEGYKPWLILEIKIENKLFAHFNLGSYFEKEEIDYNFDLRVQNN